TRRCNRCMRDTSGSPARSCGARAWPMCSRKLRKATWCWTCATSTRWSRSRAPLDAKIFPGYLINMPRKPPAEWALYVLRPTPAVEKLDRASELLGVHKKDLVAGLVEKYVDPDSRRGLDELGQLSQPRRVTVEIGDGGASVGSYSFQPYDLPEV